MLLERRRRLLGTLGLLVCAFDSVRLRPIDFELRAQGRFLRPADGLAMRILTLLALLLRELLERLARDRRAADRRCHLGLGGKVLRVLLVQLVHCAVQGLVLGSRRLLCGVFLRVATIAEDRRMSRLGLLASPLSVFEYVVFSDARVLPAERVLILSQLALRFRAPNQP